MIPTNHDTAENLTTVDFKSLCNWNSWWYSAIPEAIRPLVKIIIMCFFGRIILFTEDQWITQ